MFIVGRQWEKVVTSGTGNSCFVSHVRHLKRFYSVVYTGTYQRALDGKLRVLLPKRLRNNLPKHASLFLTPGTDHCLELHTDESLNQLAIKASQSSASSSNVRSFSRLFYARAEQCDIDNQGRIRIPGSLAELADLEKEVVFIGVGFHWEIWNATLWQDYLDQNGDAFDQLSETTFGPPIATIPPSPAHSNPELKAKHEKLKPK